MSETLNEKLIKLFNLIDNHIPVGHMDRAKILDLMAQIKRETKEKHED